MKMKLILTVSGTIALATTSYATTIFSDNFDSLAAGALDGQGGWSVAGGAPVSVTVSSTDPGFGMSGNVLSMAGSDDQFAKSLGGSLNDTGVMTLDFDVNMTNDNSFGFFGITNVSDEIIAWVGADRGNITLRVNNGSGGLINSFFDHNLTGSNQVHITMTIDPKANSGAGSADVAFAVYTDETTLGASTTALSGVALNLDSAGRALSDVDGVNIRMHNAGATALIDNLAIAQVPEPSSTALLGLGVFALILRRRK